VALGRPARDGARDGGPRRTGLGGGVIRNENIKKHIKYGSVEFKGPFIVFILVRQNYISSNAFPVYPKPFLQYQFFQDMVAYLLNIQLVRKN
jgi:hypothetical protein